MATDDWKIAQAIRDRISESYRTGKAPACPKCGNTNMDLRGLRPELPVGGVIERVTEHCGKCGFYWIWPEEVH